MVIGKGATPIMFPGKQTDTQCERGVGVESHALGEGDAAIGGERHAPNRVLAGADCDAAAGKDCGARAWISAYSTKARRIQIIVDRSQCPGEPGPVCKA